MVEDSSDDDQIIYKPKIDILDNLDKSEEKNEAAKEEQVRQAEESSSDDDGPQLIWTHFTYAI